ncbi:MAG: YheU family protein [Rhodopirellula sp.]|nr:YheU family protein [Rhodopirellula sp.]
MRIPHTELSPVALRAVVEEFVTRDGTDHSPVELRIETVLRQLDAGRVELHFDAEAETCHFVPVEGSPRGDGGAE